MFRIASLLLLIPALAGQMTAQVRPAAAPVPGESLASLAWLLGGTWVSDVKDPSDGSVTHVENRIRWAPNRHAIEFDTNFNGKPHYNGFYAWNPASRNISFFYTSSEGDLATGTAASDADGRILRQEFDIVHADGRTGHLRSTTERDGSDAYWFTAFMQKDGEWLQVFRIRYERKGD
ncbi:MAG TPA: hypothetical protein VL240_08615 [Candidatus Binatia bacterium]|nr:hypothetical protein [Candidatus Binatia bacterium]